MAEPFRDTEELRAFLSMTSEKYTNGEVVETRAKDGAKVAVIENGDFKMVDTYFSDETEKFALGKIAAFNGSTIVSVEDRPVWGMWYNAQVANQEALDFYFDVTMAHPDPEVPTLGEHGIQSGGIEYRIEPLFGSRLSIARFTVRESMYSSELGREIYVGHPAGQWLT